MKAKCGHCGWSIKLNGANDWIDVGLKDDRTYCADSPFGYHEPVAEREQEVLV